MEPASTFRPSSSPLYSRYVLVGFAVGARLGAEDGIPVGMEVGRELGLELGALDGYAIQSSRLDPLTRT